MADGAGGAGRGAWWRSGGVWGDAVLVLALGLFVTCYRVGVPPLAGTEGHRALPAHEMVRPGGTGDWLLPRLYGPVYLKKPPMVYWLIGGVEKLTGVANEATWRMPSAIAGGVLGLVLCLVGNYWFGRTAGLVAGLSHVGLIALAEGYRSADIDALDIAASVITGLAMIEMMSGSNRRRWALAILTGLGVGVVLLLKGPGGLPEIMGAILGAAIFNVEWIAVGNSTWLKRPKWGDYFRELCRPGPWIAIAIGAGLFGAYLTAASMRMRRLGIPPDTSGLAEAVQKMTQLLRQFPEVAAMPFLVAAYSLPLSAVVPMALRGEIWNGGDARRRWYLRALVGTLAVSLAICFFAGISNPRYAYVIVPPLALVAGAVADRVARGEIGAESKRLLWRGVWAWAALMFVATVAMGIAARGGADRADIIRLVAGGAIALAGWLLIVTQMRGWAWPGRTGVVVLMLGLGINMAMMYNHRRAAHSTAGTAQILAEHVKPTDQIVTGATAMDQPELFWYAGVYERTRTLGDRMLTPLVLPSDGWVVLKGREYTAWSAAQPPCLSHEVLVVPQRGQEPDAIYLAWYTRPAAAAAAQMGGVPSTNQSPK